MLSQLGGLIIPPTPSSVRQVFCITGSNRKIENVAAGFSLRLPNLSANTPESSRVEEKSPDTRSYFMSEHLLAGNARPKKIFM